MTRRVLDEARPVATAALVQPGYAKEVGGGSDAMTDDSLLDQFLAEGSMERRVAEILDTIQDRESGKVALNSNICDIEIDFDQRRVTMVNDLDPEEVQELGLADFRDGLTRWLAQERGLRPADRSVDE